MYTSWAGEPCLEVKPLPSSGSERTYFRLKGPLRSAIGVLHPVREENRAFFHFSKIFRQEGLKVPEVYFYDEEKCFFLLEDLGDITLFSFLQSSGGFTAKVEHLFEDALSELVKFQAIAGKRLDYSVCYPRQAFDRQSILWDLNYFKYNFLKLRAGFNEEKLEQDFDMLSGFLLEASPEYFMYRDFQSRNIMLHEGSLYFIDYQGGRKGPLPYDPVSLLYQVKSDIPPDARERLMHHYLDVLVKTIPIDRDNFLKHVDGFILLRLLQVLGAYGFRGLIQKKAHFITSLPYALKLARWFLENKKLQVPLPELLRSLKTVAYSGHFPLAGESDTGPLHIDITSFSYKRGIPEDYSGHGGGFVFDCRALPNPGREESMREFTGKDALIVRYLELQPEVHDFLGHIFGIVDRSVQTYQDRGFSRLSVNFGCTGGQHRSVYCAESLSAHLRNKFPGVIVSLYHRELEPLKS